MPCLDLVSIGWVLGRVEGVDLTIGRVDLTMDSRAVGWVVSIWPEEDSWPEEGKGTSVEAVETLVDSPDTEKGEMTEEKASKTANKESEDELGKRVESQRLKKGLPYSELLEEANKAVGRVGNLDSWNWYVLWYKLCECEGQDWYIPWIMEDTLRKYIE